MKYFEKLLISLAVAMPVVAHAGVVATTAHSRANCVGFNESITWYLGHSFWWRVESHHFLTVNSARPEHVLNTGKSYTWRAAAYHPTESYTGHWYVRGYHYYYPYGNEVLDVTTGATDCNIYDGWWDH